MILKLDLNKIAEEAPTEIEAKLEELLIALDSMKDEEGKFIGSGYFYELEDPWYKVIQHDR